MPYLSSQNSHAEFAVVELNLAAKTGQDAIREIHHRLRTSARVRDEGVLLRDLLRRHELGASFLDQEVALAHARTFGVDDMLVAAARSTAGVWFDAAHPAVRLVLLVAAPTSSVQEYLSCTAALARRLHQSPLSGDLLCAATEGEFRRRWAADAERVSA